MYEEPLERTNKSSNKETVVIPSYEDETFIEHHSEYCFQCLKQGTINNENTSKVSIGKDHRRTRLLLCNHCSFAFHNNCISLGSTGFDRNTKGLKCQKCIKSTKCLSCNKSQSKKNETVPFRCLKCFRLFHKDCILSKVSPALRDTVDKSVLLDIYESGQCVECSTYGSQTIESVLTEKQVEGKTEYLIKWKELSFRKADWVSANWVSHFNTMLHRGYLKKKEAGKIVTYSEDWLLIDRIIDVEWSNKSLGTVKSVLAVFKDRDYGEGKERT
jgi:hypothetical protein